MEWRPTASLTAIKARAELQKQIRAFFRSRDVLEVETPLLAQAGVTDVNLVNATTSLQGLGLAKPTQYYLQTSPEYAMKRLLAAGVGDCFQLCKVVRNEEVSARHNFEFTLLEWYRLGFTDTDLMSELDALMQTLLDAPKAKKITYQQAFIDACHFDPLAGHAKKLSARLTQLGIDCEVVVDDYDALQNLAMSLIVEPSLNPKQPTFITHFPASQAVLAKKSHTNPQVAHRFELFYGGLELANGFWELTDAKEQRVRFEQDNQRRKAQGLAEIPIDERLLAALEFGMPECSGVAVGVDRLLMLKLGVTDIQQVLCFPSLHA